MLIFVLVTYLQYPLRGCSGRNELFAGHVASVDLCASKCTGNSKCFSFEWYGNSNKHGEFGANYCQVSSTCTYVLSVLSGYKDPSDFYIKKGKRIRI